MSGKFLTDHFLDTELMCPCCSRVDMQKEFLQKLEWLRVKFKKPIRPTSAFRCPKHNAAVGGEPQSYHMLGRACDIPVYGPGERHSLVMAALELRLTVIIYDGFVHVDNRDVPLLLLGRKS